MTAGASDEYHFGKPEGNLAVPDIREHLEESRPLERDVRSGVRETSRSAIDWARRNMIPSEVDDRWPKNTVRGAIEHIIYDRYYNNGSDR